MKLLDANRYREALLSLSYDDDCWCECAIDNPMLQGRHTEVCKKIKELFEEENK